MPSLRKLLLGLGLLAIAHASPAALITLDAEHFSVTYDDAQAAPYGQGFVAGSLDTIYFQPSTLSALSGGSPATTPASLQLSFTINPGYTFAGLNFAERGDYFLLGTGTVGVDAAIQAVNADTSASVMLNLAPAVPLDMTGNSTLWDLTGSVVGGLGLPQTLLLTLDNELFASAPVGELSFIQKTYVGFQIVTVAQPVPEPSTWALLLAGMLAALLAGRRRMRMPSGARSGRRDRT
ncbi:MAG: PEP-CTERM sorting domain-containing protein [Gammaproteobacteria bacterium]|nr:PEP-CTERM sorting domain-containing protein [Gammaproteobacteria bacterium]MBU1407281.1 PEP-CTERM sorting domain-containing protein [Gammaproteobacteria bacterium]MBU1531345.1 PEP-CTERM sorting domain-containing protein [Gammaproteobacteria bacterium]